MSAFRRFALVLLLVAIAPGIVLSGMPVKYCASSAGEHQALEFVLDGVSHGGEHASHHQTHYLAQEASDHCEAVALAEPQSCTDASLPLIGQPYGSEPQFLALPAIEVAAVAVPKPEEVPAVAADVSLSDRLRTDPRMSAHRVTVLRI